MCSRMSADVDASECTSAKARDGAARASVARRAAANGRRGEADAARADTRGGLSSAQHASNREPARHHRVIEDASLIAEPRAPRSFSVRAPRKACRGGSQSGTVAPRLRSQRWSLRRRTPRTPPVLSARALAQAPLSYRSHSREALCVRASHSHPTISLTRRIDCARARWPPSHHLLKYAPVRRDKWPPCCPSRSRAQGASRPPWAQTSARRRCRRTSSYSCRA